MARQYEIDYLDLLLKDMGKFRNLIYERISELEKHKYFDIYRSFVGVKTAPIELNNIGVTYNNKIVELYHLYESKGLDFADSDLVPVILSYFRALLDDVTYYLDLLDKEIVRFKRLTITPKVFFKRFLEPHIALIDGLLVEFANIDNEIANFSIEKEFKELLETEKDYIQAREEYGNPDHKYPDAVLHNCYAEYGMLGYGPDVGKRYILMSAEREFIYKRLIFYWLDEMKKKIKVKYQNFPYTQTILINRLNEIDSLMNDAISHGSIEKAEVVLIKTQDFDELDGIVDEFCRMIAYYKLEWDLESFKKELIGLGIVSKYDELVQKLNSCHCTTCTDEVGMRKSLEIKS